MEFSRAKIKSGFLILCWALYDLANQFFALNVVSLYFPRWLTLELKTPEILYSLSFGISMFFVAISAPILGAISDKTGKRKMLLVYFTLLSVIFTIALGFSPNIFLTLTFFAVANFGCQGAIVFYNSLMVKVSPPGKIGLVSGLGRMFGYGGAILALCFSKPVILKFGYQATFLLTGILFLIFSLPCMIFIKDEHKLPKEGKGLRYFLKRDKLLEIFRGLKAAVSDSCKLPGFKEFLLAAFFGICAVNVLILFMSVYASKAFALSEAEVISLIAFSTIFAIAGSILSGFISDYFGYRRSLIGVFILWIICLLGGGLLRSSFHWLVGALAGISLGATWVIARALVIRLAPKERIGEAFGLFNLAGYLAAIVGPLFWGIIILYFSHLGEWGYRFALLSLILFMALGLNFSLKMPKEGKI